jgi:hypothetical protein
LVWLGLVRRLVIKKNDELRSLSGLILGASGREFFIFHAPTEFSHAFIVISFVGLKPQIREVK